MKFVLISGFTILAVAASAAGASASSKTSDREDDHYRRVLNGYAECLVDSDKRGVRSILLADPNSGALERWRAKLRGECMLNAGAGGYYLNPDNVTLRFALADALMNYRPALLTPGEVAAVPALSQPNASPGASGRSKGGPAFDPEFAMLARLGECIVRADPAGAAVLLKSKMDSSRETASIQRVLSSAPSCTGGRRLQIDTVSLRGVIALNYFRVAMAARRAAARTGADE